MKWHPQKNPSNKQEAELRFRDIAEAYDVLDDPERRARFDEFGEMGLKHPQPDGPPPYKYVGDPYKLFHDFFASANPFVSTVASGMESAAPGLFERQPEPALEIEVPFTLVELMDGSPKRVLVERTRLGPSGSPFQDSKPVMLPVKPGWEPGMRVTFKGEGNHTDAAKAPGDLVFVVVEKVIKQ